MEETILSCCLADTPEEFEKQKTNLQKFVKILTNNLESLTNFS